MKYGICLNWSTTKILRFTYSETNKKIQQWSYRGNLYFYWDAFQSSMIQDGKIENVLLLRTSCPIWCLKRIVETWKLLKYATAFLNSLNFALWKGWIRRYNVLGEKYYLPSNNDNRWGCTKYS